MDVYSVSADANHRAPLPPLPPPSPPPPLQPTHSHLKQHESHTAKLDCRPPTPPSLPLLSFSLCLHPSSYANEGLFTNSFIKTNTYLKQKQSVKGINECHFRRWGIQGEGNERDNLIEQLNHQHKPANLQDSSELSSNLFFLDSDGILYRILNLDKILIQDSCHNIKEVFGNSLGID